MKIFFSRPQPFPEDVYTVSNRVTILDQLLKKKSYQTAMCALTACARMKFEEMADYECEEIRKALRKYFKLDTMAMVMIYER